MSPDETESPAPNRPVPPAKIPRPVGQVFKSSRRTPPTGRAPLKRTDKVALLNTPGEPNPPLTPEELAVPVASGYFDPATVGPDDPLPLPVRIAFEELVFALHGLSETERAAARDYTFAELVKRIAG